MSDQVKEKSESQAVKKPAVNNKVDKPAKNDSVWAKAAETIAGDNKLLGNVLKFVLSPIGAIILLCGAGYLIWKNKTLNDKQLALQRELLEAKSEIRELQGELARTAHKMPELGTYEEDDFRGSAYSVKRQPKILSRKIDRRKIHLD
jgi:hypothetical protein